MFLLFEIPMIKKQILPYFEFQEIFKKFQEIFYVHNIFLIWWRKLLTLSLVLVYAFMFG